jgi:hypothetical protein
MTMSIARTMFGWSKPATTTDAQRAMTSGRYPTHTCVTLPDGQLMYVRNASLAAAKDLLAAQRAAERRLASQREARILREATEVVEHEQAQRSFER